MAKERGLQVQTCSWLRLQEVKQCEVEWEVGRKGNSAKNRNLHCKWIMDNGDHYWYKMLSSQKSPFK